MGQSSSQMAPTQRSQPPQLANIQMTTISADFPPFEASGERPAKKRKVDKDGKHHRLPKARPQHRRGVAIQPRKDAAVQPAFDAETAADQDAGDNYGGPGGAEDMRTAARFKQLSKSASPESFGLAERDTSHGAEQTMKHTNHENAEPTGPPMEDVGPHQSVHRIDRDAFDLKQRGQEVGQVDGDEPILDREQRKELRRQRKKERKMANKIAKQTAPSEQPNIAPNIDIGKQNKERKKEKRQQRKAEERLAKEKEVPQPLVIAPDVNAMEKLATPPPTRNQLASLNVKETRTSPTARIENWLDGHEREHLLSQMVDPNSPEAITNAIRQRRSSQYQADDCEEYQDGDQGDEEDGDEGDDEGGEFPEKARAAAKRQASRILAQYDLDGTRPADMRGPEYRNQQRGTKQGQWSETEKKLADVVWNGYVQENDLNDYALRLATIKWPTIGRIKTDMYDAFPDRTIETIRKFVQRRFTPYKQGPWTEEEEELLIEEHDRAPGEWTLISAALMRPPQAIRDRWRNITQDHVSRLTGPWSMAEEMQLIITIRAVIFDLRTRAYRSERLVDYEPFIDWKQVNQSMGGTRSAKRCVEKWHTLRQRYYSAHIDEMRVNDFEPPDLPGLKSPPSTATSDDETDTKPVSKNQAQAEAQYALLEEGDIFDALFDIEVAMQGQLDKVFHEETTLWSIVATYNKGHSKYTSHSNLRRMCYYGALRKWRKDEKVKLAVGIGRKAELMQELLLGWREEEQLKRVFRTSAELDRLGVADRGRPPRQKAKKGERKEANNRVPSRKSEAFVIEDDDGEDNAGAVKTAPPRTLPSQVVTTAQHDLQKDRSQGVQANKKRKRATDATGSLANMKKTRKEKRRIIVALNGSPRLDQSVVKGVDESEPELPDLRLRMIR